MVIVTVFEMTKNPTMETLMQIDHVHENRDDHCSAFGF